MHVEVRGFTLDHFDGNNPKRPDIHRRSTCATCDDFGCGPVGAVDHSNLLRLLTRDFSRYAKVSLDMRQIRDIVIVRYTQAKAEVLTEFDTTLRVHENIAGSQITMHNI